MCLSTLTDLLAVTSNLVYPHYDVLTAAKWLAKTSCKIPIYMKLGFYYKKNTNFGKALFLSLITVLVLGVGHELVGFFLANPSNIRIVLIILFVVVVGTPVGAFIYYQRTTIDIWTSYFFILFISFFKYSVLALSTKLHNLMTYLGIAFGFLWRSSF